MEKQAPQYQKADREEKKDLLMGKYRLPCTHLSRQFRGCDQKGQTRENRKAGGAVVNEAVQVVPVLEHFESHDAHEAEKSGKSQHLCCKTHPPSKSPHVVGSTETTNQKQTVTAPSNMMRQ